jgi:uncharacterized protein YbjT (DUF2867 family)
VGATGLLGSQTAGLLLDAGKATRALVRPSAPVENRTALEQRGAEIALGDLKNPDSLASACRQVSVVVSSATAIMSQQPDDTLQAVDEDGQLALIEAAERARVEHFVFVSFPPTELDSPLERAKRKVEARLQSGSLSYTILRPVDFTEVWLSRFLGFDPVGGKVIIFGDGTRPVSWISVRDVARFAAAAADGRQFAGKVLSLGGPEPLSPLKVVDIFRELGVRDVAIDHVPEAALRDELASASDPRAKTFAASKLSTALGQIVDPGPALALLPGRLVTVRDYATEVLNHSN